MPTKPPSYDDTFSLDELQGITTPKVDAPSYDDTISLEDGPSALSAGVRGTAQGISFGLADELVGGVQTLGDLPQTGMDLEKLYNAYKGHRDTIRQADDAAKAAHPEVYSGAEFVSGFLNPSLGAAKVMSAVPKLAKNAGLMQRLGNIGLKSTAGATVGTAAGGLTGFGNSEATDLHGIAGDTLEGAKNGAMIGALIPGGVGLAKEGANLAGAVTKATVSPLQNVPAIKRIMENYNAGRVDGVNTGDLASVSDNVASAGKQLGTTALGTLDDLSNRYNQILDDVNSGTVNIADVADEIETIGKDLIGMSKEPEVIKDIQVVLGKVRNYTQGLPQKVRREVPQEAPPPPAPVPPSTTDLMAGRLHGEAPPVAPPAPVYRESVERVGGSPDLTPRDAKLLSTRLGQLGDESAKRSLFTEEARAFSNQASEQVGDALRESVPGIAALDTQMSGMKTALKQLGLDASDFVTNTLTGTESLSPSAIDKLQTFIVNAQRDSKTRTKAMETVNLVLDNMKAAGVEGVDDLRNTISKAGEHYMLADDLARGGAPISLGQPSSIITGSLGGLLRGTARAANAVGRKQAQYSGRLDGPDLGQYTGQAIQGAAVAQEKPDNRQLDTMSTDVYGMQPQQLAPLSNTLRESNMGAYADKLDKALSTGNNQEVNSVLFVLLQTPQGRATIKSFMGTQR